LEYLVNSIPEELSTILPQHLGPAVIVSNESERSGAWSDPTAAARGLRAHYLIQGSVRGIEEGLTVNLQLIHSETGAQLWSERFDFRLTDTNDSCNEIIHRIALSLSSKLGEDVYRRVEALRLEDCTSEDLIIRGHALLARPRSMESDPVTNHLEALRLYEQALIQLPDSTSAKLGVACVLLRSFMNSDNSSCGEFLVRAEQLLAEVLRVNARSAQAHNLTGALRMYQGRLSDSLIEHKLAIALEPNHSYMNTDLAFTLTLLGQPEVAIPLIESDLRLAPLGFYAPLSHGVLGLCRLLLGNVDEALTSLRTARAINPRICYVHWLLAAAFGLRGELDEAGSAFREAIEMKPDLPQGILWMKRASPEFQALFEKAVYFGLRRAGLQE
jgi:adenylate cyclase